MVVTEIFTMAFGDYQFVNDTSFSQMQELLRERRLSEGKSKWIPPKVELVKVNMRKRLPPADYLYHASAAFFSERATEALADVMKNCGDFLPCHTQGREIIYTHDTVELAISWRKRTSTRDYSDEARKGRGELRVWYEMERGGVALPNFFRLKGISKSFFTQEFFKVFEEKGLVGGIPVSAEEPEGPEWRPFFYPRELDGN
jgi:hypothetical protein